MFKIMKKWHEGNEGNFYNAEKINLCLVTK
jgi:hypothetical protein